MTRRTILASALAVAMTGGTVLTLARPAAADDIDYAVPGVVPKLQQPSDNTCWATAATMLLSWKDQKSYPIKTSAEKAGAQYAKMFDDDQGLDRAKKPAFLRALGLKTEAPQNYTVEGWQ